MWVDVSPPLKLTMYRLQAFEKVQKVYEILYFQKRLFYTEPRVVHQWLNDGLTVGPMNASV